ncbi:MAG: DnaJ domain-containing protein [Thermodesulfobacteriota bacterium]|nr:DnaJ domain-containing protein [Thermodesulfobacteriota bacterium]
MNFGNSDYYQVLGIHREADDIEVKKAYRSLAHKYHPDKNFGDKESEAKFQDIVEAYEVLNNTEKRLKYDNYRDSIHRNKELHILKHNIPYGISQFDNFFYDFFKGFYGIATYHRKNAQRGEDIRYNHRISLEEATLGVETVIKTFQYTKQNTLVVKIPPGIETGTRLCLHGKGGAGINGGLPGDLYVVVYIEDHPI